MSDLTYKSDSELRIKKEVVRLTRSEWETMHQLHHHGLVWDGDLVSKIDRDSLMKMGFVCRVQGGYQQLTNLGQVAYDEGRI